MDGRVDAERRRLVARRTSAAGVARAAEAAAALALGVAVTDLRKASRCRARVALARQVGIYLARVGFEVPYSDLGRAFGRDRTTAAHACRVVEDRRDDAPFDQALSALEAVLPAWHGAFAGEVR